MNQRIEELAEEAGLEFEDEPGIEPEPVYYGYKKDLEKFAELIVRDCALTAGLMEHLGRKGIGAVILDNYGIKDEKDC